MEHRSSCTDLPTPATSRAQSPAKRRKLTGRAFYESLGSPQVVMAPMVDQSEFAWRLLSRSFMNESDRKSLLCYSPMLHSRLFRETQKFRDRMFQPTKDGLEHPHEYGNEYKPYLDGHPEIDRPLFVQFCANDPDELFRAAKYVQPFCDAVDLNLGCPQNIARKGNYGAFLQEDQGLVCRLISKLHQDLEVPVTAKIRILRTREETLAYARRIVEAGASIITVHGRQREQKGHYTGLADWSVIRYLREQLPADTVIFANGNILQHDDIQKCLDATGADAVMTAEGNLYDPTIFATSPAPGGEGREYWRGRNGKGGYRMDAVFRRYMDIIYKYVLEQPAPSRPPLFIPSDPSPTVPPPSSSEETAEPGNENANGLPRKKRRRNDNTERTQSPNLLHMQPHCFHFLRALVSQHTHIRDALAKCLAGDIAAYEQVLQMVEAAVREGLLDYERDPSKYDDANVLDERMKKEAEDAEESSVLAVMECRRPWWVCQPRVRPLPKEAIERGSITLSKKEILKAQEADKGAKRKGEAIHGEHLSKREKLDEQDGVPVQQIAAEAMVAG